MMKSKKGLVGSAMVALATLVLTTLAPAAYAHHVPVGCKTEPTNNHCTITTKDSTRYVTAPGQSLAAYLTSDGGKRFGTKWTDFDIATELVLWVLSEKPSSNLQVLTAGDFPVTGFIPTDRAFRKLAKNLTDGTRKFKTEESVFNKITSLGVNEVEKVLQYHIVVGPALVSADVLKLTTAELTTLLGDNVTVNVSGTLIRFVDGNTDLKNAKVVLKKIDLNLGNVQIAHGISRVLMP